MMQGSLLDGWASAAGRESALRGVQLRRCTALDMEFLEALYASTREAELALTGWPASRCRQFIAQQFALQHHYYQAHFPDAHFLLILREGRPLGRLYWWEGPGRAVLVDMILLPAERGQGVGSALMRWLVERAERQGLDIELHVEPGNPALRLYRRFGFATQADNGMHARMRRPCSQTAVLHG